MSFVTVAEDPGAIMAFATGSGDRPFAPFQAAGMVFEDPISLALQADLDRIAPSDASVLVIGETGTGKELISRYIHARSRRHSRPFIGVNCGTFSEGLADAELFGFERGAFTGATRSQAGWFETANGGTLLLDEIGDLPLQLQVKLLRVLQEHEVVRVGSRRPIPIDVRVIAATNVDLEAAVQDERFREDLYFRLSVASVWLAPLRERRGDIAPLARYFLDLFRIKVNRPELTLGPTAIHRLIHDAWPGNIRQLENTIHNAALLSKGPVIGSEDIRLRSEGISRRAEPATLEETIRAVVERAVAEGEDHIFSRMLHGMVRAAFDMTGNNQLRAAEVLGMSRNAMRTHLGHLGAIPRRRRARNLTTSPEPA